jgi:LysM repeat protein
MPLGRQRLLITLVLLPLLTACIQASPDNQRATPLHVTLMPYRTEVAEPTSPGLQENSALPTSTPEPVTYTVVAGDSLSVIALRFGVDLNALILANPGVNANAMPVGTKLVIPPTGESGGVNSSNIAGLPTPVIDTVTEPDCYLIAGEKWICFLLLHNDLDKNVGNVTGQLKMNGSPVLFPATCPLDVIPAGEDFPLVAWIQAGNINPKVLTGRVKSAITIEQSPAQYEVLPITEHTEKYQPDRRSVVIDGRLTPLANGFIRILAYAQDAQGHVLGFRLWDSNVSVPSGEEEPFRIYLYSLGGAIVDIRLLAQITVE